MDTTIKMMMILARAVAFFKAIAVFDGSNSRYSS
jgi:hypothetical protein